MNMLRNIKNSHRKLVCRIDDEKHLVEIKIKDIKTTIQFGTTQGTYIVHEAVNKHKQVLKQ